MAVGCGIDAVPNRSGGLIQPGAGRRRHRLFTSGGAGLSPRAVRLSGAGAVRTGIDAPTGRVMLAGHVDQSIEWLVRARGENPRIWYVHYAGVSCELVSEVGFPVPGEKAGFQRVYGR
jgi:hypothetical protein